MNKTSQTKKNKTMKNQIIRSCLNTLLLSGGLAAGPDAPASPQLQPGWPVTAGGPVRGAAALGNIAGDARLEVVIGAMDSKLHALNADGTVVSGNWPVTLAGNVVSAPALADFDGDGFLEIVVMTHNGYVYVIRGDGSVMPGWPQTVPANYSSPSTGDLSPSPVIANLDGDADFEILITGNSQMDVFEVTGSRWGGNWPVRVSGYYYLLATPAVADLDNDGQVEIVICARSTYTGTVYAFETDGTYVSGFNQFQPGNYINAAPVIVDLDRDGFKEIIICGEYDDNRVYLLDHQGNLKPGWPVATKRHESPPAIGDVDGDGELEIVVASRDNPDGIGSGWIYAIKRDGSLVAGFPWQTLGHFNSSAPALADIDQDGLPEIIVGNQNGNLYAVDGDGTILAGWPFATGGAIESSVALGDMDLDGHLEVVFGSDDGNIYCLDLGAGSFPQGQLAWPTFHYNNQRTGFFDGPATDGQPPSITCPAPVTVYADMGKCYATGVALGTAAASDNSGAVTVTNDAPTQFPVGVTVVTWTAFDPSSNTSACTQTVTVTDNQPTTITCPGNLTVANDPGQCFALVNFTANATDNCPGVTVVCNPPSGSIFPKGATTITCTTKDSGGATVSCSFIVTVEDREAPLAACREAANPAGKQIPVAGKNPTSRQNPDGFHQLLTQDNCDANPRIFIVESASSFIAGPFANGDVVKITQRRGGTPEQKKMSGVVSAHILVNGDPFLYAVDADGNVSTPVNCFGPPPRK